MTIVTGDYFNQLITGGGTTLYLLVRFTQGMDGLLGDAGMILTNDEMDHSRIPENPCV